MKLLVLIAVIAALVAGTALFARNESRIAASNFVQKATSTGMRSATVTGSMIEGGSNADKT